MGRLVFYGSSELVFSSKLYIWIRWYTRSQKTLYVVSGQTTYGPDTGPFDGAVPFSLRNVETSGFGRVRSLARVNDERGRGWWMR
jgi:hypothetical protein